MSFARPPAADDPQWPRASAWLAGSVAPPDGPGVESVARSGPKSCRHALGPDRGTEEGSTGRRAGLRVVGVPCSVGSISPSRASETPPAVREALARLSPWDADAEVDLAAVPVTDEGDWPVADLDLQPAMDEIQRRAATLDRADVHAFLGGDNAITRPLAAGLLGPDLSRVGLLTFDAHHDVRHLDDGPRNGTPVRGLIADGLDGRNVVQIGIGAFTNSHRYADWCQNAGITAITADQARADGVAQTTTAALRDLADRCDTLFVDVDMDVLDVAFAPACPGARPGGLTPAELFAAVRLCGMHPKVAAADFVEVDATTDHDGRTVMATAMALLAFASGVATR